MSGRSRIVSRIPNATVAILRKFMIAKLKNSLLRTSSCARVEITLDFRNGQHHGEVYAIQ